MRKQRNFDVQSIDEIKTGFMGYDKEAVLEYILLLLKQVEEVKEEEFHKLTDKFTNLENDNKKLQGQLDIYKENYQMLNKQLDDMTKAWEQNVKYAAQRDALLREYQQKEASIKERLEKAELKAKNIVESATENKARMMEQVNKECEKMVRQGYEKVAVCKLELAKIVSQLLPIIRDESHGEGVRPASTERELIYEDHL